MTGNIQKPRVLVLDNSKYQKLFDALLGSHYELLATEKPDEALALAQSKTPDLILIGNSLENGDGIAVAKQIRESGPDNVPILLMLTNDQPSLRRRAEQAGCNGFLIKPFDTEKLKSEIERFLKASNGASGGSIM